MVAAPGAPTLDDLPEELAAALAGATLAPVSIGMSGAVVARVEHADGRRAFLKLRDRTSAAPGLEREAERLAWMSGRFPAPELLLHGDDERSEWLLTAALGGVDATASPLASDPSRLAAVLGRSLRRLHDELDVGSCPFDGSTSSLVAHARHRVDRGLVDPDDFQPIHRGLSPDELLELVEATAPSDTDEPVVTHGDYCLPNVILESDGTLAGLVDLGLLGVGDRYRDLGIGARSVAHNLGGAAVGSFIDGYGLDHPDLARLDAFVMIDELF